MWTTYAAFLVSVVMMCWAIVLRRRRLRLRLRPVPSNIGTLRPF
jgi:hypothetical protein